MRRLAVLLTAVLLGVNVRAADKWTYAASAHFELYTTGTSGTARDALKYFEDVRDFCSTFLKLTPTSSRPTRLIVFSNDRQFAPYRPNDTAVAYYQSGADRDYIVMKRFDALSNPTVVHEYMHLVFRHARNEFPVWLNEGLAEFFSTMEPEKGTMVIGKIPEGRLQYLAEVGATMFPLRRLFEVGQDSPEYNARMHTGVFYSQSWLLTHMLLVEDSYRTRQDKFLQLMANGARTSDALLQVYGKTPEVVERDMRNYMTTTFRIYRPVYKNAVVDAKYDTRAVESFEADLVTANLLANSPKGEEAARQAFVALEQQKPNDVALLESRAYFELRRRGRDAALPFFGRASEMGSRNPELLRDYARLDPSKAALVLPRALALAPDDADIRIEYAALLLNERRTTQAVASLLSVQPTQKQAFRYYQLLANGYVQLNQVADAREAAAIVMNVAEDSSQAAYAKRLMDSIDQYAQQQAAFEARSRAASAAVDAHTIIAESEAARAGAARAGDGDIVIPPVAGATSRDDAQSIVTGRIRNISSCNTGRPVLEVLSSGRMLRLLVDDGARITVVGKPGGKVDLTCAAQDVPIKVGYTPGRDSAQNTIGYVRLLDYR